MFQSWGLAVLGTWPVTAEYWDWARGHRGQQLRLQAGWEGWEGRDRGVSASSPPRGCRVSPSQTQRGLLGALRVRDTNSQHRQPGRTRQMSSSGVQPSSAPVFRAPRPRGRAGAALGIPPGPEGSPPLPCALDAGRHSQESPRHPRRNPQRG